MRVSSVATCCPSASGAGRRQPNNSNGESIRHKQLDQLLRRSACDTARDDSIVPSAMSNRLEPGLGLRQILERVPTELGEAVLSRRRQAGRWVYEVILNGVFLMSSEAVRSEIALG